MHTHTIIHAETATIYHHAHCARVRVRVRSWDAQGKPSVANALLRSQIAMLLALGLSTLWYQLWSWGSH